MEQDTPEEETLAKIKFVLLAGNDAQAIRLLEQYGGFMQEKSYSEEEMLQALNIGFTSTDETWEECVEFAKEQFKKK